MKIADRIITTLTALCAIPAALFAPVFGTVFRITGWDMLQGLVDFPGAVAGDKGLTEFGVSVWWLIDSIKMGNISLDKIDFSSLEASVAAIVPYFKWSMILLAVGVVISFVLAMVCAFTNAKKIQIGICAAGIADLIASRILFDKFASPILEGKITSGTLIKSITGWLEDSNLGSWIFSSIIDIETLYLSTAWVLLMMIFAFIVIWNTCYMLTLPKENKLK